MFVCTVETLSRWKQICSYEERTGNESVVYFTRNLSAEGLIMAYEQVCANIDGYVGVKIHTGEPQDPNIIPREWVKALIDKDLKGANVIETNTYYAGDRYILIDLDNVSRRITVQEAVQEIKPLFRNSFRFACLKVDLHH